MQYTYYLQDERKIEYEESFWTGKKIIKVDGILLESPKKKFYILDEKEYKVQGNFLTGVKLIGERDITIVPPLKTWEYILACLPLLLVLFGGAIGGLLGAVGAIILATVMRRTSNIIIKIGATVGVSIVAYLCWEVIATFIISLL